MEGKILKNAKTWGFLQRENIFDPDMIRTRYFLIRSQMCYPCTSVLLPHACVHMETKQFFKS
jgi:hypothetical protein